MTGQYDGQHGAFPPRFGSIELSHFEVSDAPRVFEIDRTQTGPVIVRDSAFTAISDEQEPPAVQFADVSINGKPRSR